MSRSPAECIKLHSFKGWVEQLYVCGTSVDRIHGTGAGGLSGGSEAFASLAWQHILNARVYGRHLEQHEGISSGHGREPGFSMYDSMDTGFPARLQACNDS